MTAVQVKARGLVRAAAGLALLAVIFVSLGPPRFRPATGIPHDVEHFAAFALLGLLVGLAYPSRPLVLSALAIAAAAGLEALQMVMPGRHAYLTDVVVNGLAACVGIGLRAGAALLWGRLRRA